MPCYMIALTCGECGAKSDVQRKRSFLGFPKLTCPKCDHDTLRPLGGGYRAFYIVLVVLGLFGMVAYAAAGRAATPGLLFLVAVYALYRDSRLKRNRKQRGTDTAKEKESRCPYCHAEIRLEDSISASCGK